ncbi:MAG: autotransporter outer membrane beta-barrel domain-containing protein [Alphaproteobacteria bacterium]|nr:autotransporter outer membrane beta-barrel domain-containing protein [Alphaproteobacteria bacterium]
MTILNGRGDARGAFAVERIKAGIAVAGIAIAGCVLSGEAQASSGAAQEAVKASNNATQSAIQSAITTVRDFLVNVRRLQSGSQPLRFDGDANASYDPFEALGYAKSGMVTKARPMAAPAGPNYFVSAWGQGSADHERRSLTFAGADDSSRTTSFTGLGGGDVVRIGLADTADALVIGLLGSHTSTHTDAAGGTAVRSRTPGVGAYLAYINGGFSMDFSVVASFTSSDSTVGVVTTNTKTDSYTYSANMQNRFDMPNNWWIEPTVGIIFTQLSVNTLNFTDGHSTRLQGGARVGTEWTCGTVKIQPSLTGLAFGDVVVESPVLNGTAFAGPTDKGYLWGKGVGKVNFQWTEKFSTSGEAEIRGRADVIGYGARVQARYTF